MTQDLYICANTKKCDLTSCPHKIKHESRDSCSKPCFRYSPIHECILDKNFYDSLYDHDSIPLFKIPIVKL